MSKKTRCGFGAVAAAAVLAKARPQRASARKGAIADPQWRETVLRVPANSPAASAASAAAVAAAPLAVETIGRPTSPGS
eukprot:SAG22_NODE_5623_length_982_cov_1.575311_2_plen_79_part_00